MSEFPDGAPLCIRDIFYPRETLEGRNNYKRYLYIDRDGSVTERIYLNIIDKRQREEVICVHFLQFLARHLSGDDVVFNIISRDDTWDFVVEISNGLTFNIEIVSIADNKLQFQALAREEARDKASYQPRIRLRDLQKTASLFPDEALEEVIVKHKREGCRPDDLVENVDYGAGKRIYVSSSVPRDASLAELIGEAIASKESKRHDGKQDTVLVIDNRTSVYYVDEVISAIEILNQRLVRSPFKEIWFYNGYCSDWDGNNGQYTFIGCKVTPETQLIVESSTRL